MSDHNNNETEIIVSTEPHEVEVLPKRVTPMSLYSDYLSRNKQHDAEKEKKKKDKKEGGKKNKKDADLDLIDNYIGNMDVLYPGTFDPFRRSKLACGRGMSFVQNMQIMSLLASRQVKMAISS